MMQSLSGTWQFRLDRADHWQLIDVPGCWETLGMAKNEPGPAWYRRDVQIPAEWAGKRIWLRFDGVSYACSVLVNGQEVGGHVGLWDGFRLDITDAVQLGNTAEIMVRVEKPASLTSGPSSHAVPGRFPQRETLSGFLPYVWGHMFGGLWQDVWLEATGRVAIEDMSVRADHAGNVRAEVRLTDEAEVELAIFDPEGKRQLHRRERGREVLFVEKIMPPRPWSPQEPTLYEARVSVADGETRSQRLGMRSLRADGPTLQFNERPFYPRMILSWGWYEQSLHANPSREQVRRDFVRLRQLGYNGVKLCLWVPPAHYFDVADETGMLLWLELPMWMPRLSAFFLEQTPVEYEGIVRQVRHRPSIVLYTLGCELDATVGGDLLERLYKQTKALIGDTLLRDNSGSGEAYGGLLDEFADYYDYHFYTDIQFLRPLLDLFSPRWRAPLPFLFGEFCDLDTFRDLRKLYAANNGALPWWAKQDDELNPQGARWQFDIVEQERRLRANGFWDRQDELEAISCKQALLHRKFTLELVRTYREVSGYVVTGERDTPISTAGMWTGLAEGGERLKFDPLSFRGANDDVVLSLGWDKRRAWINGGDRAAYWDTFSYAADSVVRAHVVASNYGAGDGTVCGNWSVAFDGDVVRAVGQASGLSGKGGDDRLEACPTGNVASLTGQANSSTSSASRASISNPFATDFHLSPGGVRALTIAEFVAPPVDRPTRGTLRAQAAIGDAAATWNQWPLWFFPTSPADPPGVRLIDPPGRLDTPGDWLVASDAADVVLATAWTREVRARVESGGRAILLQAGRGPAGPVATAAMPFWREAVKVIEPHAAWGDFPHEGWCDLQFFGMATDYALESARLNNARPILRRVDARTMAVHDYAVELELGAGRVIVSTLRFEGGLGEQPVGLSRNTAAAYLLACWARYLGARGAKSGV